MRPTNGMSPKGSARIPLGSWTFPSGNSCDVSIEAQFGNAISLSCAWDSPPPLSAADEAYYVNVVLPEIASRAQPFLGEVAHAA